MADALTIIIDTLKETDELPRKQITEIVEVLGNEASISLLEETKVTFEAGGMAVRDGTRQRTIGGVFFSLAKSKLPKPDRNRIFRIRPPKPEEASVGAPTQVAVPRPPPPRDASPDRPRRLVDFRAPAAGPDLAASAANRRRVVEVEVLRQHPRPAPPPLPQATAAEAPRPAPAPPVQLELKPVRRIVQIAAPPKEEPPPATPDAARDRVRVLLKGLSVADQRKVVLGLMEEIGGFEPPAPKQAPVKRGPPPAKEPDPEQAKKTEAQLRERVLAAVTDRLGLTPSDLAKVLYGDDGPGARSKARVALDKWRK